MKRMAPYVRELRALLRTDLRHADAFETVREALNGRAAEALRDGTSIKQRRDRGAFFTPPELADRVVSRLSSELNEHSSVLDPACGAGDLLLAVLRAAQQRPGGRSPLLLRGIDVVPEFTAITKLRVEIALRSAGITPREDAFSRQFSVGSTLTRHAWYKLATHIVMNPPFIHVQSPVRDHWAQGRVNAAAVFFATAVREAAAGARITAVLPSVLLTGPRYRKWRAYVRGMSEELGTEVVGKFAKDVDVDVVLLDVRVNRSGVREPLSTLRPAGARPDVVRVRDVFQIAVGRVVEYRDPSEGSEAAFLRARELPLHGVATQFKSRRRHKSTPVRGPLIVIRRTASPSESLRVKPTLIGTDDIFFVENHLIALTPHDGTLETCRRWMPILGSRAVTDWMNTRTRCRHLTVGDVAEIPADIVVE